MTSHASAALSQCYRTRPLSLSTLHWAWVLKPLPMTDQGSMHAHHALDTGMDVHHKAHWAHKAQLTSRQGMNDKKHAYNKAS